MARGSHLVDRSDPGIFTSAHHALSLPKLIDLLDHTRNDDQPLLFIAIQVLYRMHMQDKSLSPDNLAHFRNYVERHQKLGDPDRAIVETWRRFVLK